jgi:hypothetical protein
MRLKLHLHSQGTAGTEQLDTLVNESHKMLNSVQERPNFHLSGWSFFVFHTRFNPESVNKGQPLLSVSKPWQTHDARPRDKTSRAAAPRA